jgi:hypothetical protein
MFRKDQLNSVKEMDRSLMPPYTKLSASDLQNLIAYLNTLRGAALKTDLVDKAPGIR